MINMLRLAPVLCRDLQRDHVMFNFSVIGIPMTARFDTVEMASGGLALVLEPEAARGDFPVFSEKWAARLGAGPIAEPVITVDECILEVKIASGEFWITYDDFQGGIQLEPKEPSYNPIVLALQTDLRNGL
jgi:hypothetical protein